MYETLNNQYETLAIAVVNKAVVDYRNCCFAIKNEIDREEIKKAKREKSQIEKFFRSRWGDILSFGYADLILERLKKEQEDDTE